MRRGGRRAVASDDHKSAKCARQTTDGGEMHYAQGSQKVPKQPVMQFQEQNEEECVELGEEQYKEQCEEQCEELHEEQRGEQNRRLQSGGRRNLQSQ